MTHDQKNSGTPTMSEARQSLLERWLRGDRPKPQPIPLAPKKKPIPLTPVQQRILLNEKLFPGSSLYNLTAAFRLTGPVDTVAFETALRTLAQRHAALAMNMVRDSDVPALMVDPAIEPCLEVVDIQSADVDAALSAVTGRGFDVHRAPLYRMVLFRESEREHLLAIVVHHLVGDGWSLGVAVAELTRLYRLALDGGQDKRPLPLGYDDYAAWYQATDDTARLDRQLAYWHRQLSGAHAGGRFPTEYRRAPVRGISGSIASTRLSADVTTAIGELARRSSASVFSALLSALAVFVARHIGDDDVFLGTAMVNRPRGELDEVIGPFINTTVVRPDLSGSETFLDVLHDVHRLVGEAVANQDVPFERVVELLRPQRQGTASPLIDVMCVFQNSPLPPLDLPGVYAEQVGAHSGTAKFDLTLIIEPRAGELELSFEYDDSLFSPTRARGLVQGLATLVATAVANPGLKWSRLPVTAASATTLLAEVNDTACSFDGWQTVFDAITHQATSAPDRVAVRDPHGELRYSELVRQVATARQRLTAAGVGAGDRVGIMFGRTCEMVAWLLGVWEVGAAYVPLDPGLPRERLRTMIEDSAPVLIVVTPASGTADTDLGVPMLDATLTAASASSRPSGPAPGALAYLIYTSGSTGTPKAVAVRHSSVVNFLKSMAASPGLADTDVLMSVTSLSFDIALLELFLPLTVGGRVELVDRDVVVDGRRLLHALKSIRPTVMQATPSTWRLLLQAGWTGTPGLRVLCGGEALTPDLADALVERAEEVWNLYGPTETTVWSTVCRVDDGRSPISVGSPISNTRCYVVDAQGEIAPPGVTGELYIAGAGVAAGYWGRPELTRELFIEDPFTPGGGPAYRTGDLARLTASGRFELVGRLDHQLKVQGHRIELGEIEACLLDNADVAEAGVVAVELPDADVRLRAFAVIEPGATITVAELDQFLRERLPRVMVPASIQFMEALPKMVNGKLDRAALSALPEALPRRDGTRGRSRTEAEIASLWSELLRLEDTYIDAEASFFESGGHSLSAMRLLDKVRERFGTDLDLAKFFQNPSICWLAKQVELAGGATPPQWRPDPLVPRGGPGPMSLIQRRLWILEQLQPSGAYNTAVTVTLRGRLDVAALDASLAAAVARHDVLRSSFHAREGEPTAVPLDVNAELTVVDMEGVGLTAPTLEQEIAGRPFDLRKPPLMRAVLLRTGKETARLTVVAHHIIADAWSMHILAAEIAADYAYTIGVSGVRADQTPVAQYSQFANWELQQHEAGAYEDDIRYWLDTLADYSGVLTLPTDAGHPSTRDPSGTAIDLTVSAETMTRLGRIAADSGATLFMALLTAFQVLLYRFCAQPDVVVGVPIANRSAVDVDSVVGCFVNTIPIRTVIDPDQDFATLLTAVKDTCLAAFEHQGAPFEEIVRRLDLPRDLATTPLIQAMFVFQNGPAATLHLPGVTTEMTQTDTGFAKYDLTLTLWPKEDGLSGTLQYARALFQPGTVRRLIEAFNRVLDVAAASDTVPVGDIPLTDEKTFDSTIEHGNEIEPMHVAFRRMVDTHPDVEAIRFDGGTISYRALDLWSDRVAARLAETGLGARMFAALLLPAGPIQVTVSLAVMKLGAAFVFLDDRDPDDRICHVVDDAAPYIVVATTAMTDTRPRLLGEGTFADRPLVLVEPSDPGGSAQRPAGRILVTLDDPLFLVYTSGTTGGPKGICHRHATAAQFAAWQTAKFEIGPGSRVAQWAPFSYDVAYTEMFAALTVGATLSIPSRTIRPDPAALADWLHAERVSHIQLVPSFSRALCSAVQAVPGRTLPHLRHLLHAGEVLPPDLARDWLSLPGAPIGVHNLYGPTECILATVHTVDSIDPVETAVPVGRAITGREVKIVDERGHRCPPGVVGHIVIRSPYLGEYFNRPKATAEAFTFDSDGWWYRTGDLGRMRDDGLLAFHGRIGSQVKIHGNRVELEEIEATIQARPDIAEAVVTVWPPGQADGQLAAYVVPTNREQPVIAVELRSYLATCLPAYMVPATVTTLTEIPRTRTNKHDRAALPAPSVPTGSGRAPRGTVEVTVASVWSDVLGRSGVGRDSNFFDIGGDSLLATRLQSGLCVALNVPVRLVDVFAYPTVATFAASLDKRDSKPGSNTSSGTQRGLRRKAAGYLPTRRRAGAPFDTD